MSVFYKNSKFKKGDLLQGNAHFKTNFSIDQKEDTEDSEYDQQQMFQMIPFEKKFEVVNHNKTFLHNIETVLIPALSHEITYTGSWSTGSSVNAKFGDWYLSSTPGDTAEFEFSGVSCFMSFANSTARGEAFIELSNDSGSTWYNKKIMTFTQSSGTTYNETRELYSGLEYGNYKVRLTIARAPSSIYITFAGYTTYMNQRPITQYYTQTTHAKTIDDVPPTTTLLTGNFANTNQASIDSWNNTYTQAGNGESVTLEFKFYGSKIWGNLFWNNDREAIINVYIDDSQDNVLVTSFDTDTGAASTQPSWIRLDDGTLDEDWHTVKLDITSGAGEYMRLMGWGYYSADETIDTTIKRSLICGKESYAIGVDDSSITFDANGGSWTGPGDSTNSFLRRLAYINTNGANIYLTTPNNENLKAIYLITSNSQTDGSIIKSTLGGDTAKERWIDLDGSYTQTNGIKLLYDKAIDGDLHNKILKIFKDEANAEYFYIEGIIFEIGNTVEDDYIWCMPKWTRYNNSVNNRSTVSMSQRLDVYGTSYDLSEGRKPMVHSGWCEIPATTPWYYNFGLGIFDKDYIIQGKSNGQNKPSEGYGNNGTWILIDTLGIGTTTKGNLGIIEANNSHSNTLWQKIKVFPNRVI